MAAPLRHRQTKEAETDMFDLQPPRHISTLPSSTLSGRGLESDLFPQSSNSDHTSRQWSSTQGAHMPPNVPCPCIKAILPRERRLLGAAGFAGSFADSRIPLAHLQGFTGHTD